MKNDLSLICLGSARASRAGRGALASAAARNRELNGDHSTRPLADGEGAVRNTRGACAPQISQPPVSKPGYSVIPPSTKMLAP